MSAPSGSTPAETTAAPDTEEHASATPGCEPPKGAKHLVLSTDKYILPMKQPDVHERGAVTSDGKCPTGVECARIDAIKMKGLVDKTVALGTLRTKPKGSPHYGGRYITLDWDGGRCQWADASQGPLVEEDRSRFSDAFDAIIGTVIGARGQGPKP